MWKRTFADGFIRVPFYGVKDILEILGSHGGIQQLLNLEGEQYESRVLFRIFFNRLRVHVTRGSRGFLRAVFVSDIMDYTPRGTHHV